MASSPQHPKPRSSNLYLLADFRRTAPRSSAVPKALSFAILLSLCGGCASGDSSDSGDGADVAGVSDVGQSNQSNSGTTSSAVAKSETVSAVTAALFIAGDSAGRGDASAEGGADTGTDARNGADLRRQARRIARTLNCPEGGTAQVAGEVQVSQTRAPRTFSLDASASLAGCNGSSGDVAVSVQGTANQGVVDFTASVSGSVSGTCSVNIPGVTEEANVVAISENPNSDARNVVVEGTLSGQASADCNGQSVRCSWNNVDISDRNAIEAGCSVR